MTDCEHEYIGVLDPVCKKCGDYEIKLPNRTMEEHCKIVADFISNNTSHKITPEEVWTSSRHGEIFQIIELSRIAHIVKLKF